MLPVYVHIAPPLVLQKMNELFDSLQNVKIHFEEAADSVTDKLMQLTLRGVAQESSQYANELSCKIQTMGGNPERYFNPPGKKMPDNNEASVAGNTAYDEDIIKECASNELPMMDAYRDLLNDPNLYADLQSMIRYQLDGIMYGYKQMELLYH